MACPMFRSRFGAMALRQPSIVSAIAFLAFFLHSFRRQSDEVFAWWRSSWCAFFGLSVLVPW